MYLIRHGATQENRARVLVGQTDPPLSDESRAQLRSTRLPFEPEAVYTSPLRRAAETAHLLFPSRAVTLDPDLMERGFGDLEGSPISPLTTDDGGTTYAHWDEETLARSHGEPIQELEQRINRFRETLLASDARTIAVVSHGTLISHMVRVFFGEASRRASPGNLHVASFRLNRDGAATDLAYDTPIDENTAKSPHKKSTHNISKPKKPHK